MGVKMYRQGDVVIIPTALAKKDFNGGKRNSLVLKEGEATGHKHEVVGEGVMVLERPTHHGWRDRDGLSDEMERLGFSADNGVLDEVLYLTAENDFKVVHPEHGTLTMRKGNYLVFSQREYDEERDRRVRD